MSLSDSQAYVVAVVDDDNGVRTSLSSLLRSEGYQARTYASATEFLDGLPLQVPDCLICDMQMPDISGEQLQARLQAMGHGFPVIIITAFPTEALRGRLLAAGVWAFLEKPVGADAVTRMLERARQAG